MRRHLLFSCVACFLAMLFPYMLNAQVKNIYGPYLQNITATEATIVWEATEASVGWVELAPDDDTSFYSYERRKYFDCTNGVKNTSLRHVVRLTGLEPGTTYRYRVYSQQVLSHQGIYVNYDNRIAADNVYSQKAHQFKTLDTSKNSTSFLVINDIHGRVELIPTLLEQAKYKEKELIFFNGDIISITNGKEDFFNKFMNKCIELFAQEKSPYYCRGNHETRGEFATHFQEYFNPCQPHLYFTLRHGPVFFIFLDCGEDKPDTDIEYSGIVDYDGYRSEQAEWLKTVKNDPEFKSAAYRVVIAHMPTTPDKGLWHGGRDCIEKFTPQLNQMDIDVMICGHNHQDSYHESGSQIRYPVLVNSNNGVVDASVNDRELKIRIIHNDGKTAMEKTFQAKAVSPK